VGRLGRIKIMQRSLTTDWNKRDAAFRTDFERLTRIQAFLLSLMLLAPVDPIYATTWDPLYGVSALLSESPKLGGEPSRLFKHTIWVSGTGRSDTSLFPGFDRSI
jgi:hypothetical protein